MFGLKISGGERIGRALRTIGNALLYPEISKWVVATTDWLGKKAYPPELPNQRYRRTGTLKGDWHWGQRGTGAWAITNAANQGKGIYSRLVVGDASEQAKVHAGRWWIAVDEVERQKKNLPDDLAKLVEATYSKEANA